MKKIISLVALLLTAGSAFASQFHSVNLLNAQSVLATNTINITNLLSWSAAANGYTNVSVTIYTNKSGNRVITGPGTNSAVNLLIATPLWDGGAEWFGLAYTNSAIGGNTPMDGPYYNASVYIRLVGESGANAAVTFALRPIPSAFNPLTQKIDMTRVGNDSKVAADQIVISLTATTTTEVASRTKIDLSKFAGCAGIMLSYINNADTDASSGVTILEATLNYWSN